MRQFFFLPAEGDSANRRAWANHAPFPHHILKEMAPLFSSSESHIFFENFSWFFRACQAPIWELYFSIPAIRIPS